MNIKKFRLLSIFLVIGAALIVGIVSIQKKEVKKIPVVAQHLNDTGYSHDQC